jgi:hypothetical protein
MSLRNHFDIALKKGDLKPEDRARALGVTVKKGDDAARHLQQAQDSLGKIRAKQAERQKQSELQKKREHA